MTSREPPPPAEHLATEVVLEGGRANTGRVVRVGNEVARPTYPQTDTVEHFLEFLIDSGVAFVPRPLQADERGRQRLRFIEGIAPTPPYPAWAFDDRLLVEVAGLQRRLHQVARHYEPPPDPVWATSAGDYFPPDALVCAEPIVCHNDLGMTNLIVDGARSAVGIVDFDYCRPVDPLFDIAVAVRHWAPFGDLDIADDVVLDRVRRFAMFCDVHDLEPHDRGRVVALAIDFLDHARSNLVALAAAGNTAFRALLADGYEATNRATIDWIADHRDALAHR